MLKTSALDHSATLPTDEKKDPSQRERSSFPDAKSVLDRGRQNGVPRGEGGAGRPARLIPLPSTAATMSELQLRRINEANNKLKDELEKAKNVTKMSDACDT